MTNPTTPFGWQMPTSTDLVTDLPADFETFGQAVATSMADLLGGTTGQVLSKASNTDMDFTWVTSDDANAIQNAIVDAKGDLIAASAADTPARLAVGANYGFLQADSGQSTGLVWNSGAWTSYGVTVTATSGTFTTVSGSGNYMRIGKTCVLRVYVSITTNGTAAGAIKVNLPFAAAAGLAGVTREVVSTGAMGQFEVSGSDGYLYTPTNTYPGANNRAFVCVITYEVA
jgi:hypothetical protein